MEATAIAVQADVSKGTDVTRLFEETKNAFGNAGYFGKQRGLFKFTFNLLNRQTVKLFISILTSRFGSCTYHHPGIFETCSAIAAISSISVGA